MTVYKADPELKAQMDKYLPPLPEDKYQELKANIATKGYDEAKPIVIWEERPNTIVDGHHRCRACRELGIEPIVVEKSFKSINSAVAYAIRGYLTGRELTGAQRVIAEEYAMCLEERERLEQEAKEGQIRKPASFVSDSDADTNGTSREVAQKIADKANTSARTVYQVHAVQKKGVPEVMKMLESGELGSTHANDFVQNVPKEKQSEIIKSGGIDAVKEVSRNIRAEREEKTRKERESEELQKFNEFNRNVARETAIAHAKIDKAFKDSNGGCLLPNVAELWCDDCEWGFDVFLPTPSEPCCPYCKGENVTKRSAEWNPRGL